MILVGPLAVVTAISLHALWIRRATWGCRWECSQTLSIMFLCASLLLMTPTGHVLGQLMYRASGVGHLDTWIGHSLYICAAVAMLANVLSRVTSTAGLQRRMKRHVETVAAPAIALMFAALVASDTVDSPDHHGDIFRVPVDTWLTVYWLIGTGTVIYLLLYVGRCLLIIYDQDARSRLTALHQFTAVCLWIAACAYAAIRQVTPVRELLPGAPLVWGLMLAGAAVFAVSSIRSWRNKARAMSSAIKGRGDDQAPATGV